MALNLLLIDPDEDWLHSTTKFFEAKMYKIQTATNGKKAQLSLYNDQFFAVILSHNTRDHSAPQVLRFIRSNHAGQKVIYTFNEEDYTDKEDYEIFYDLGATELIWEPYTMEDITVLLEGHHSLSHMLEGLKKNEGQSDELEVKMEDSHFTPIRIDEFYSSESVLFDLYIKLGSNRYVKILHAGDQFSKKRIKSYKEEKGVTFLYFHQKDRRKYIQFNNWFAKKIINLKGVDANKKINQLKNVSQKYIEEIYTVGLKPQVIEQGKEIVENISNFIEQEDDLYKLLKKFEAFDPKAYEHSFIVSIFATAIIKQFEWKSKIIIESTALACLFHDIGKLKLDKELINVKPQDMNTKQLEMYQQHPIFAIEMIDGNRMISNIIRQIILQHHEAFDGSGFPFGLTSSKILFLSNIVACANDFTHLMINNDISPPQALKMMLNDKNQMNKYNSKIIQHFIRIFIDPKKISDDTSRVI